MIDLKGGTKGLALELEFQSEHPGKQPWAQDEHMDEGQAHSANSTNFQFDEQVELFGNCSSHGFPGVNSKE